MSTDSREIIHYMLKSIDEHAVVLQNNLHYQFCLQVLYCNLPVLQLAPVSPNVILNMHKSIKSCVMNNGVQSVFFYSHVGLRQGDNSSPLLFAIFLNDMETFFPAQKWNTLTFIEKLYNDSNDGINGMLNLFVLLYADDTVIMAEN